MYYVYTLAKPNGDIFYVGKGTGNRIDQHEYEAKTVKDINGTGVNPHKINTIRKIWRGGGQVVKAKVYETADEEEAYNKETELIEQIGIDKLTNIHGGGVQGDSISPNAEWRGKHALWMRETNLNAKVWEGFIDPLFGVEYKNIVNLHRFCEEHNLSYQMLVDVHNGKQKQHKGWRKIGEPCWLDSEAVQEAPQHTVPSWLEDMVSRSVSTQRLPKPVKLPPLKPSVVLTLPTRTRTFEKQSKIMCEFRKYMGCVIL